MKQLYAVLKTLTILRAPSALPALQALRRVDVSRCGRKVRKLQRKVSQDQRHAEKVMDRDGSTLA